MNPLTVAFVVVFLGTTVVFALLTGASEREAAARVFGLSFGMWVGIWMDRRYRKP